MAEAAEAQIAPEPLEMTTKEAFEAYIDKEAPKYGIDPQRVKNRVSCETGGIWNPSIQSGYYRNNVREQSYGLAQINLPSHKNISYVQATDPKFALDYIIKNWNKDHWSCP